MTRRSKLKLGVGAILSLIVVMSTSPSWARTLQEILSAKKIRLGTIPYPPMTQLFRGPASIQVCGSTGPNLCSSKRE